MIALALFAMPATAGHPQGKAAQLSLMEGVDQRSVFTAALAEQPPLEGTGENIDLIANVALSPDAGVPGGANDKDFASNAASDIELAGDYAYVGSYAQGMVIVNISSCDDPSQPAKCQPFVQGAYKCSGGQFDVQLSPDANIAVVAHESQSANKECHKGEEGFAIVDISNKSAPREIAFISDKNPDGTPSGQVSEGAHNVTLDWPNLYVDQYFATYTRSEVFSLANPSAPAKIGEINFTPNGGSGPHDMIPDHRPDGKNLLYAASILVRCRSVKPCRGTLRLQARLPRKRGSKSKKARRVTIGRRSFGVGAGKRRRLQIRLNTSGRRLVKNNKRLRLYAFARLRRQAGLATASNTARGSYRLISPKRKKR